MTIRASAATDSKSGPNKDVQEEQRQSKLNGEMTVILSMKYSKSHLRSMLGLSQLRWPSIAQATVMIGDIWRSPREWCFTLRDFLVSKGFKATKSDHSLCVNEETRVIVSVYVDDIQIYGPKGSPHIAALKSELHKRFAMTDLGHCQYYLGMEIQSNRAKRTVRITQTTYLKKVLARFGLTNCTPVATPMVVGTQLQEELVIQTKPEVVREYQSMIGSIMYPMIQT